jgi:hypothetical protein
MEIDFLLIFSYFKKVKAFEVILTELITYVFFLYRNIHYLSVNVCTIY